MVHNSDSLARPETTAPALSSPGNMERLQFYHIRRPVDPMLQLIRVSTTPFAYYLPDSRLTLSAYCCVLGSLLKKTNLHSRPVSILKSNCTAFCFNAFDDIFKQDGCEVCSLNANVMVTSINCTVFHNTIGM